MHKFCVALMMTFVLPAISVPLDSKCPSRMSGNIMVVLASTGGGQSGTAPTSSSTETSGSAQLPTGGLTVKKILATMTTTTM